MVVDDISQLSRTCEGIARFTRAKVVITPLLRMTTELFFARAFLHFVTSIMKRAMSTSLAQQRLAEHSIPYTYRYSLRA